MAACVGVCMHVSKPGYIKQVFEGTVLLEWLCCCSLHFNYPYR